MTGLIEFFNKWKVHLYRKWDIYQQIASTRFGVDYKDVTEEQLDVARIIFRQFVGE